jgi:molybdenum cofactor biosynthesis enzyme MoaA
VKKHRNSEWEHLPVKIEITDNSLMMILLLEKCNFTCAHCVREDEPMDPDYKLSFEQFRSCLSDCRKLESISWVHFTGGEPTLWAERKRDLVDLLLEIAKAGFTPGLTTNGSFFVDYDRCHGFFGKYADNSDMPLRVYLSIDTFHNNFSAKRARARSLDNVIKCKQELPRERAELLDIVVQAVVSKDPQSLLPTEMIEHYEFLGVRFGFVPLLPKGKAKSFRHLCPDLSSSNPEDLGAYRPFHEKKSQEKRGRTKSRNRVDFIHLIGNDYYLANPWRKVAQLGHLPDTIIRAYSRPAGGIS